MDLMEEAGKGEEKLKAGSERKPIPFLCNVSLCSEFGVCCCGGLVSVWWGALCGWLVGFGSGFCSFCVFVVGFFVGWFWFVLLYISHVLRMSATPVLSRSALGGFVPLQVP